MTVHTLWFYAELSCMLHAKSERCLRHMTLPKEMTAPLAFAGVHGLCGRFPGRMQAQQAVG